jgi:protein SCO1/2
MKTSLILLIFIFSVFTQTTKKINVNEKYFSELSIFNLTGNYINSDNKSIKLSDFSNKITVISMIFTRCEGACPIIAGDILKIETQLDKKLKEKVNFALVSFDAENDNSTTLSEFKKKMNLGDNWQLLSGKRKDVHDLSLVLGINYKKQENAMYSHSNKILVLNQKGEVAYSEEGLDLDPTTFINEIEKLLKN